MKKGRLGRFSEHAGRNASERRAGLETNNAEADPPCLRGRLAAVGKRATRAPSDSAGVLTAACVQERDSSNTGSPVGGVHAPTRNPRGPAWAGGVAERLGIPGKPGNAAEGRSLSSRERNKGQVSPAYRAVDAHAIRRLRQWLCRKHKVRAGKYVRFSDERLWNDYGLTRLVLRTARFPWRRHDLVREPGAGNWHAGFDERGEETWLRWRLRHRHVRKPPATATPSTYGRGAPLLDSTRN